MVRTGADSRRQRPGPGGRKHTHQRRNAGPPGIDRGPHRRYGGRRAAGGAAAGPGGPGAADRGAAQRSGDP